MSRKSFGSLGRFILGTRPMQDVYQRDEGSLKRGGKRRAFSEDEGVGAMGWSNLLKKLSLFTFSAVSAAGLFLLLWPVMVFTPSQTLYCCHSASSPLSSCRCPLFPTGSVSPPAVPLCCFHLLLVFAPECSLLRVEDSFDFPC